MNLTHLTHRSPSTQHPRHQQKHKNPLGTSEAILTNHRNHMNHRNPSGSLAEEVIRARKGSWVVIESLDPPSVSNHHRWSMGKYPPNRMETTPTPNPAWAYMNDLEPKTLHPPIASWMGGGFLVEASSVSPKSLDVPISDTLSQLSPPSPSHVWIVGVYNLETSPLELRLTDVEWNLLKPASRCLDK